MTGSTVTAQALAGLAGREIGVSDWVVIDQPRIDGFAEVTGDRQFIHIDPARAAAETPFGGTVAHGFLTLSLLSTMAYDALPVIEGTRLAVNYGFDRVRFLAPVRAGSRLRGRFTLTGCDLGTPGEVATRYQVTMEIEGGTKPALIAEWLTRAWGDFDPQEPVQADPARC